MADKKRLSIKDLIPATDYAVQIRVSNAEETSEWSRKFTFTTTDDTVAPKVPTGFAFTAEDGYYKAVWDEVTKNVDESNARILRYGLRLDVGAANKIIQVEPSGTGTVEYRITASRIEALFGKGVTSIDARVRAVNIGEIQGAYTSIITAGISGPDAPTAAVVENVVDGFKVSWTPPVNMLNVDGYHVYVSTVSAGFTPNAGNRIYEGVAPSTSYSTSTYSTHYLKIRSYSRFGKESTDLTATALPISPYGPDTVAPSVPTGLSATVDRSGAVARALVTWSFTASGTDTDIQSFAIRYRKPGDANWFVEFADKAARSMYVDLPQPYSNYEFQIASVDFVANYSAWSSTYTLSSGIAGAPPTTTGLTVVPGLGDLQISWTASTHDDVTYGGYYEVQVATNSGFSTGLLTYKTSNLQLAVAGLALSTAYWVRVRAVDVDGNAGGYSTAWNGSTTGITPPAITDGNPVASSPAATATAGIGSIFVSWPTVANADPVTYEVHMSTTAGFTPTLGGATKVAETPGTIVTLIKDASGAALSYTGNYYFRIIAKDADTNSGNAPAAGTVSAVTNPKKSGNADVVITADAIAATSLSAGVLTIASGGSIRSSGYVANTSGYMLSDTAVDIQTGIVNFGTLKTGTLTATTVTIGATGNLIVDSTGAIKSNNYSPGSTGWSLSSTGLDLPGLSLSAGQISGDTIQGRSLTITSGGYIQSSNWNGSTTGWKLDYNGLTIYNGTIQGATVRTNQLMSNSTGAPSPSGYTFSINSSGYLEAAGAYIYGSTTVGSGSSHFIQTSGYTIGASSGWRISGDGNAYFGGDVNLANNGRVITGTSGLTALLTGGAINFTQPSASSAGGVSSFGTTGTLTIWAPYNAGGGANGRITLDSVGNSVDITGGFTVSGSATITGNLTMGASLFMGGFSINNVAAINGAPTFSGNPTWNNTTTGGTANVAWNGGQLRPVTSSQRYKEDIEDLLVDLSKVYALKPRKYVRKADGIPEIGFIAEEAQEAGLDEWVMIEDGQVESFDYYKYVVALQAAVVDLNKRVKSLEAGS